jgi:hypothetical protein
MDRFRPAVLGSERLKTSAKFQAMRRTNDLLWKGVLESVFDDLLGFIYPDTDQLFDLGKGIGFLDKELAEMYPESGKKTDTRYVDKLVKVYRRNGSEQWILIHLEVQAETKAADRVLFPERMFRYFYRIFDRYRRPVAAIAIFTGRDGALLPVSYEYSFMNTRLVYHYHTLCILDFTDEELGQSENPFSWVILAAKKALLQGKDLDKRLLEGKLFIFRKLYERGLYERHKLQAIFKFMDNYIRFENPETNRIFKEQTAKITGKKNAMDIFQQVEEMCREEGREEGLKLGDEKTVKLFLSNTEFSMEKIAALVGVSVSYVQEIKDKLDTK